MQLFTSPKKNYFCRMCSRVVEVEGVLGVQLLSELLLRLVVLALELEGISVTSHWPDDLECL
jgi:hypothetical protein